MIHIDIAADLNMVDDDDRNVARLPQAHQRLVPGAVAVAGRPGFWSWALIEEVTSDLIYFRQISGLEASERGAMVDLTP